MKTISYSNTDSTNYQISKKQKDSALGTIAAIVTSSATGYAIQPFSNFAISKMIKINKDLADIDKKKMKQAALEILDEKNLSQKGVKLNDYRKVNEILNGFDESVANGKSAFFAGIKGIENVFGGKMFANEVVCNMEKLPAAIFHEIGHAFNANNSTFWRTIQKMKKHSLPIAGYIALYCALTKKAVPKEEGNMELTKGQKVKNFIRENSGKLAFIATLPMLAEEGMASIRGNSWAKEFLSPDLAKKVSQHNKFAYITYLATAVGFALSAYTARKVKDYFVDKKNAA